MEIQDIKNNLERFFMEAATDCPYGLPYRAVYHQALFDTMPDLLMGLYLDSGYRRNGNIIYNMHCGECRACVPLRLDPQEFKPNRNQRRVLKKNLDLNVETAPLSFNQENLDLLDKFLTTRFPGRDSSAIDYYNGFFLNHITRTVEFRYRSGSRLIGSAIVDLSADWLNVVFFYFDPEEEKRSPGTYNILYLTDFCRQKGIKFIYLGYWIKDVKAMSYKAQFNPHYLLHGSTWQFING
ncbi:MAG: arginyltransferase [Deltaproteobacteria bacterium]|jgi:arginine-tRNA-protein transferase|nr:arginyltransferase [Deltaproteobacteria bacterium]